MEIARQAATIYLEHRALQVVETWGDDIPDGEICCGFGGFFAVKFPDISARMADDKLANAKATGADMVIAGDLGCLLHLAGRCARRGGTLEFRHAAEVLAGADTAAIGKAEK